MGSEFFNSTLVKVPYCDHLVNVIKLTRIYKSQITLLYENCLLGSLTYRYNSVYVLNLSLSQSDHIMRLLLYYKLVNGRKIKSSNEQYLKRNCHLDSGLSFKNSLLLSSRTQNMWVRKSIRSEKYVLLNLFFIYFFQEAMKIPESEFCPV